jgi:hypothetical protein
MPATKDRRQGKARPRWVLPPRPPRLLTEQDRREDVLLDERLHKLFGPPATVHQGDVIDWSWSQYQKAVGQLKAEGLIRPASEAAD